MLKRGRIGNGGEVCGLTKREKGPSSSLFLLFPTYTGVVFIDLSVFLTRIATFSSLTNGGGFLLITGEMVTLSLSFRFSPYLSRLLRFLRDYGSFSLEDSFLSEAIYFSKI